MAGADARRRAEAARRHEAKRADRRQERREQSATRRAPADLRPGILASGALPLRGIRVNRRWSEQGLAVLLFTRDRADGDVATGVVALDLSRFGLVFCTADPALSLGDWRDALDRLEAALGPSDLARPALAGALIRAGLARGAAVGWAPDPAWEVVRALVGPLPTNAEAPDLPGGHALRPEAELWRHEAHRAADRLREGDLRRLFELVSLRWASP